MNGPAPLNVENIQPAHELLQVSSDKLSKEEIKNAIKTLNHVKSEENTVTHIEVLNAGLRIHQIIVKTWDGEDIPKEWKEG